MPIVKGSNHPSIFSSLSSSESPIILTHACLCNVGVSWSTWRESLQLQKHNANVKENGFIWGLHFRLLSTKVGNCYSVLNYITRVIFSLKSYSRDYKVVPIATVVLFLWINIYWIVIKADCLFRSSSVWDNVHQLPFTYISLRQCNIFTIHWLFIMP